MLADIPADHVWPSIHLALLVGGIIGLSSRSLVGFLAAVSGGLLGAAIGVVTSEAIGLEQGFLSFTLKLAMCAGAAVAFMALPRVWSMRANQRGNG